MLVGGDIRRLSDTPGGNSDQTGSGDVSKPKENPILLKDSKPCAMCVGSKFE